jgi:hypothetical protein
MSAGRRGQSLVLGALCAFLVMLMALMTLGIGQRVRERIQLQTMTDAAAATDATLTARTYNEIALSNRGIVGDMVAMAATFSVDSYATSWAADLDAAQSALTADQQGYTDTVADCIARGLPPSTPACACARSALGDADWARAIAAINAERLRITGLPLDVLDAAAAQQANDYRSAALSMHDHAQEFLEEELSFEVSPYQVAKTYARAAGASSTTELKTPLANDGISLREAHAATVDTRSDPEHHEFVDVGRGTRYPFVFERGVNVPKNQRFAAILAKAGVTGIRITADVSGTSDWVAADSLLKATEGDNVTVGYSGTAGCPSASSRPASSSLLTAVSGHVWPRGADTDPNRHMLQACETAPGCQPPQPTLYDYSSLGDGTNPPDPQCHLPKCNRSEDIGTLPRLFDAARMAQAMTEQVGCEPCPGVWPAYLGYPDGCRNNPDDLYCQPKQYAIIQRDYSERENPDPFNLTFRFRFSTGSSLDLRRLTLKDGTDISRQTAVAGGLAYYHYRGGAKWAETPNLMNPFWRGTLAKMDVDKTGNYRAATPGQDIPNFFLQSVNVSSPTSRAAGVLDREVFLELVRNGYQGAL